MEDEEDILTILQILIIGESDCEKMSLLSDGRLLLLPPLPYAFC